ncbi:hypothetical protein BgiMline_028479 [Biomphalaria glabrata]|uniref:Uncharacterized protein n=1 Tax=Biomphalaria glabrata TaxID=6526 RepID=A0A2C9JIB8_BIOGL|nr:hypothetical protein BgiBS90_032605 [Biomphalaria glabrata]KAI8753719.1 hypothetical protein BgiMline_014274 [Biomphalaria glabrata]
MPDKFRAVLAAVLLVLLIVQLCECVKEFPYKRYTYRKKRDDKRYKSARQRCEMEAECQGLWSVKHTKCIRMCMSEFCYNELYGDDELEEGEIDVRLNSFKGCLSQVKIEDF